MTEQGIGQNITEGVEGISRGAKNATDAIDQLGKAFSRMSRSVLEGGNTMGELAGSIDNVASSLGNMSNMFGNIIGTFPLLGAMGPLFRNLGTVFTEVGGVLSSFVRDVSEIAEGLDGLTQINRQTTSSLYGVGAAFGDTLKSASDYSRGILESLSSLSGQDMGMIRLSEINQMLQAARGARVSVEDLTTSIVAGGKAMEAYAAGISQAAAMGIELSEYMNLLGDATYGQGLSTEEAMKQMSVFRDISGDTGVSLDDITSTLNGLSRGMRTMGIQADFGESILRGFGKSLEDIGLGAENAKALTENLGRSLGQLANDPALAYVTSQFGGLQYGQGGTALGASIDLQARLLEAEKTGDQAAVGFELANAMKQTLEQFGGGRIVTVQEASADSSLETTFYTQQKLLENMFGIQSDNSARTLEMLAQLDSSMVSGNNEAAKKFAEDLASGRDTRNTTLGFQHQVNAHLESIVSKLSGQTQGLQNIAQALGADWVDEKAAGIKSKASDALKPLADMSKELEGVQSRLLEGEDIGKEELKKVLASAYESTRSIEDRVLEGVADNMPPPPPNHGDKFERMITLLTDIANGLNVPISMPEKRNPVPGQVGGP
jgi:hypothetical protein